MSEIEAHGKWGEIKSTGAKARAVRAKNKIKTSGSF
jgi:hypothetical protein